MQVWLILLFSCYPLIDSRDNSRISFDLFFASARPERVRLCVRPDEECAGGHMRASCDDSNRCGRRPERCRACVRRQERRRRYRIVDVSCRDRRHDAVLPVVVGRAVCGLHELHSRIVAVALGRELYIDVGLTCVDMLAARLGELLPVAYAVGRVVCVVVVAVVVAQQRCGRSASAAI